jgi:hypothetical protein
MFARIKKSGKYQYVQVVHNERIDGKVRQRVIATLGRLDVLKSRKPDNWTNWSNRWLA